MFHIKVGKILKGRTPGGGAGFARYIAREAQEQATQMARYMDRESHHAKDDLVTKDHGNLPVWAKGDPARFWAAGDRYETKGWLIARTYEIALARELSAEQREELVRDVCQTFFNKHVHSWAIHNPKARDGQEQPHVHLMVNERILDGIERTPQQFFRKAAEKGRDPAAGGARKDLSWNHRERLIEFRAGVAMLTNASLERAGHPVVIDPRPLKDRGYRYDREPEREQTQRERYRTNTGKVSEHWEQTLKDRERLHKEFYPYEQYKARQFWAAQKRQEGLASLNREVLVAHVQQRFWSREPAQELMQTRAMETWRALDQEIQRRGPLPTLAPQQGRRQAREEDRDVTRRWEQPLIGNRNSKIYHTPEQKNYGDVVPQNQVRFWTEQEAIDAGYRRAANDHYGRGTGMLREARPRLEQAHEGRGATATRHADRTLPSTRQQDRTRQQPQPERSRGRQQDREPPAVPHREKPRRIGPGVGRSHGPALDDTAHGGAQVRLHAHEQEWSR